MTIVSVCKMVAEVSKEVRKNEVTGMCVSSGEVDVMVL